MKKLMVGFAVWVMMVACNQADKKDTPASPDNAPNSTANEAKDLYEKNLSTIKAGISAFEKEDMDAWSATIADSARWLSSAYGTVETNKTNWRKALEAYTSGWDSLSLVNPIFLPGVDSATHQFDGSVRYYGEWKGVHKSGVRTSVNFYGSYDFNKDNKVIIGNEFFDVGGLMNAVSGKGGAMDPQSGLRRR